MHKDYTDKVTIDCSIPMENVHLFTESIIELLHNQVTFYQLETAYIERPFS